MKTNYKELILLCIDCMFLDYASAGRRIARFLHHSAADYDHAKESTYFYITELIIRAQNDRIDDITPSIQPLYNYVDELYNVKKGAQ